MADDPIARNQACRFSRQPDSANFSNDELLDLMRESLGAYALFSLSAEGRINSWDASAQQLFRYSVEQILGQPHSVVFTTEDIDNGTADKELFSAFNTGQAKGERWMARRDGSRFWGSFVVTALRDDSGNVRGYLKLVRDLSERKQLEEILRRSEDQYRFLFENNPQPMWMYDADTLAFLAVNEAAIRNYGYSREEFLLMTIKDIRPPEDIPTLLKVVREVAPGFNHSGNWRHRKKDGSIIDVEITNYSVVVREKEIRLVQARDLSGQKAAEESSRKFEERYRMVARATNDVIWDWDLMTEEVEWNESVHKAFSYESSQIENTYRWWYDRIHPEERESIAGSVQAVIDNGGQFWMGEYRFECGDGSYAYVLDRGFVSRNEQGDPVRMIGSMLDLTERRRAEEALHESEEKLRQSQKMESIGRLAGGIAHDFNNLLTALIGYSDLTLLELHEGDPLRRNILEISKASERAAALTHQLLAFSRRQVLQPRVIDLNSVVSDMDRMLRRLLGEDVNLLTQLESALGKVKADPGQIEQVIVNLAINARDAMPKGGKLTIETANVDLSNEYVQSNPDLKPGPYAMIAVSDSGTGMDEAIIEKIFEPFFTTKDVGKGTGLGLSTVYGIIKQSGGHIGVYSEVGQGTTFKIYLPRVDEEAESVTDNETEPMEYIGSETILLVEDDEIVRKMAHMILEKMGYKVLIATNGGEALLICEQRKEPIDLLLTDVVMPRLSGIALAERLLALRREMTVLYMSGYTEDAIIHHGVLGEEANFIEKPFTPDALARKIRRVLDNNRKNSRQ